MGIQFECKMTLMNNVPTSNTRNMHHQQISNSLKSLDDTRTRNTNHTAPQHKRDSHILPSLIVSSSSLSQKKRTNAVHFFEPLVSEVRCIPRTEGKNKGKLFYTKEEYSIFREEYIQYKEDQQGKLTTWLYLAYTYAADLLAALDEADKETGSANNPDKCSDASSQDFISRNDLVQVV